MSHLALSGLLYLTRPVVEVSGRHGGQVAGAGDLARDVARDGDGGEPVREEGAGVAVVDRMKYLPESSGVTN